MVAHSAGSRPAAPGKKPSEPSVIDAQRFTWWLRPVTNVDLVGEHSAVVVPLRVGQAVVRQPIQGGMLIRPPDGDHEAKPVSS